MMNRFRTRLVLCALTLSLILAMASGGSAQTKISLTAANQNTAASVIGVSFDRMAELVAKNSAGTLGFWSNFAIHSASHRDGKQFGTGG